MAAVEEELPDSSLPLQSPHGVFGLGLLGLNEDTPAEPESSKAQIVLMRQCQKLLEHDRFPDNRTSEVRMGVIMYIYFACVTTPS